MEDGLEASLGRMEGESHKAYAALVAYARMAYIKDSTETQQPRSLRVMADSSPHHLRTLAKWSSAYNWQDRVKAYDQAVMQWRSIIWQNRLQAVDDQDYEDGARLRRAARMILDQVETKLLNGEDIPPGVAAKYIDAASKAQRLATGAPTERTEHEIPAEYVKLLDDIFGKKPDANE